MRLFSKKTNSAIWRATQCSQPTGSGARGGSRRGRGARTVAKDTPAMTKKYSNLTSPHVRYLRGECANDARRPGALTFRRAAESPSGT